MSARTQLVVTVSGKTMAELCRNRDAVADADFIELRLDGVRDPDPAAALAGRRRPVIVTCRPVWEGGQFAGSEEERHRLLEEALSLGAEYVDVEWRARFDDLIARDGGRRIVLSAHDFDMVPIDLTARAHAMRSTGVAVVKIAVRLTRLSDCLSLLDLARAHTGEGLVLIGLGDYGLATRVLAGRFGSRWTYAGGLSDLGQLSPERLLDEFRVRDITSACDLYGLVGRPVAHSVSPAMHNAAFRAAHLDAVYLPLPAHDVDDFTAFARGLGVKGVSVTTPFKVALYERVDEADAVARRIGAINTIRMEDGRWVGGNTDASGFLEPLRHRLGLPLDRTRTVILGAGGAARAVAVALASSGAPMRVHARDRAKAAEVAMLVAADTGPWPPERGSWDLLVNCTPVGMYPHVEESPLPLECLTGRYVYDLVYNPPTTRLLRDAATAGCRTIGGLEMLVAQAHEQFHWWTGARPSTGIMREAALRRLAEFMRNENHVI